MCVCVGGGEGGRGGGRWGREGGGRAVGVVVFVLLSAEEVRKQETNVTSTALVHE